MSDTLYTSRMATQAAKYLPQAEKCTPISLHSTASGIVKLGTSKAAVGSAAQQCHSLSRTRQGCSVRGQALAAAGLGTPTPCSACWVAEQPFLHVGKTGQGQASRAAMKLEELTMMQEK
ncbi:MAG: hypothetical protein FRX49_02207 [Trebouxia sp. A1-2]|nr:MAG: hypothetical protein FRX49_02207 [Trebouxia sp. A1-2]